RLWVADLGDGNPFAQRHHAQREESGSAECNHTPTSASPPSPLVSGLRNTCASQAHGIRTLHEMSEAPAPSHAQRVCIAGLLVPMRWAITRSIACTTGVNARGHWQQCQGQAGPAL